MIRHNKTSGTMSGQCPTTFVRVSGFTIQGSRCNGLVSRGDRWVAVLWGVLDVCAAVEHQWKQCAWDSANNNAECSSTQHKHIVVIPAALKIIDIDFRAERDWSFPAANMPILGPLTTHYPALTRSLQRLAIAHNRYDDGADLSGFAASATQLREFSMYNSGLSSVQGLKGRCDYLRKVVITGCEHLATLAGLEEHAWLEEINASITAIASVAELRTCPALIRVLLYQCEHLASLDGLEGHQWLEEVDAACTPITSVAPLRTCSALTNVDLYECEQLTSLSGLEDHARLQEVTASYTAITAIDALQTCPALTKVLLKNCEALAVVIPLPGCKVIRY